MFRKPYKIKTSTTVKGSDRRRLRSMIESQLPNISLEDINALVPTKSEMSQAKILTHSGTIAMVFYCGTNPIFFQIKEIWYPTMYTLWKYPNLLPLLTTVPVIPEKVANGADLMAPGIIVTDSTFKEMGRLKINDVCAMKVMGNKAPFAIGTAMMSAEELIVEGVKGKAVCIVHSYQDMLFLSGDQQEIPMLPEPELTEISSTLDSMSLSTEYLVKEPLPSMTLIENSKMPENEELNPDALEKSEIPDFSMDEILFKSFFTAIKVLGKTINLPILTSTFYKTYVLKSCPSVFNLDIKKTTYKKLSVFLKQMQKEGIVQIKELTKGVESIISINMECEAVVSYYLEPLFKKHLKDEKEKLTEEMPSETIQASYKFPLITELFGISAQVKQFFTLFQMKKGDTVSSACIRDLIKNYVKENSLQNEHNPKEVILDPILTDCICKKGENRTVLNWEELYDAIISKMTDAYQIEFEDKKPVVKKGKLEPIVVTVDTRTGNKKVTLIRNLETYGIIPEKLAQHVQVAVAASTSITPTQNGKGTVVLIQGNQMKYLQKLFLDIYKVPRKYLQGLENAPKKK